MQRQKRHEQPGNRQAEHIAEIPADADEDIFQGVRQSPSPRFDPINQYAQILSQQHNLCGFPSDIDRTRDRNSDIGGVQCGGIIDPVTHEAHNVAGSLQRPDNPFFLTWFDLGKQINLARLPGQFGITQRGHLTPRHHA